MNSLQTSGVSLGFIQTCAGVSKANWVIGKLLPTEPSAFEDEAVATAATLICVTLLIPCDSPPQFLCTQLSYPSSFFVPDCLQAMLRAAQDSYVAMVVQSLTSHCWRRESITRAPALTADTRRRRRSLQLVRETVSMERKGLESEKLTSGLEKQFHESEEKEWEMHPGKVVGRRKASGQQWSYRTQCYLLFKKRIWL